jgi:hypothetical protein
MPAVSWTTKRILKFVSITWDQFEFTLDIQVAVVSLPSSLRRKRRHRIINGDLDQIDSERKLATGSVDSQLKIGIGKTCGTPGPTPVICRPTEGVGSIRLAGKAVRFRGPDETGIPGKTNRVVCGFTIIAIAAFNLNLDAIDLGFSWNIEGKIVEHTVIIIGAIGCPIVIAGVQIGNREAAPIGAAGHQAGCDLGAGIGRQERLG